MNQFKNFGRVFLPMRQSFIFNCAGKFCLAHGLRQFTQDTKSDVSCLQMFFTGRNKKMPNDVLSWPSYNIIVNILFKASIFPVIGKKNNQPWVTDPDQET